MPFATSHLISFRRDVRAFDAAKRAFDKIFLVEQNRDFRDFLVVERIGPTAPESRRNFSHTSRAVVGPILRMYREEMWSCFFGGMSTP